MREFISDILILFNMIEVRLLPEFRLRGSGVRLGLEGRSAGETKVRRLRTTALGKTEQRLGTGETR